MNTFVDSTSANDANLPPHSPAQGRIARHFSWAALVVLILSIILRTWRFDTWPGINADEAWYGVQAQLLIASGNNLQTTPTTHLTKNSPQPDVEYRTPTGNVWNPFWMGPRVLLELWGEPSFAKLRAPGLICGLLTLVVNYWLARWALGRTLAEITTLVLAVLPVMLAYSRLAWDCSQSVLFCLPVLYIPLAARRGKLYPRYALALTTTAGFCALWVHPTNLFLAPVAICLCWPLVWQGVSDKTQTLLKFGLFGGGLCAAWVLGWARAGYPADWGAFAQSRLGLPSLGIFLGDVVGIFSGASVYESISWSYERDYPWLSAVLATTLLPTVVIVWRYVVLIRNSATANGHTSDSIPTIPPADSVDPWIREIAHGTLAGWVSLLFVAGPESLTPGYERYGLWGVAPIAVLFALILSRTGAYGWAWTQAGVLLVSFSIFFVGSFWLTGGLAHPTYRVTEQLRKERMAKEFQQGQRTEFALRIGEERWWVEWPVRYLTRGGGRFVEKQPEHDSPLRPAPGS
ncbi:MAG: hypothetical protein SFX18_08570 [Pirellulales bacterium]|nr:hypothetical protein [Pirellulales bacterium]